MKETNIFEYAIKNRLRFSIPSGIITTEDLYSMSLTALDNLYKGLKVEEENTSGDKYSLSKKRSREEANKARDLEVKIALVKTIYEDKQRELENRKEKKNLELQLRKLIQLDAEAEEEKIKNLSGAEREALKNEIMTKMEGLD